LPVFGRCIELSAVAVETKTANRKSAHSALLERIELEGEAAADRWAAPLPSRRRSGMHCLLHLGVRLLTMLRTAVCRMTLFFPSDTPVWSGDCQVY